MPVAIREEFQLPATWTAVGFSCDAQVVMGNPDFDWSELQRTVMEVLEEFHLRHDHDTAIYFCAVNPLESKTDGSSRLGVLFAWEGEPSEIEIDTLNREMKASSHRWVAEGMRAVPRRAFPSIAIRSGKKFQIWISGRRDYVAFALSYEDGAIVPAAEYAADSRVEYFLPGLTHALGMAVDVEKPKVSKLEMMKVAYALHVSEKIIEADGEIAEGELALLRRIFPARRLNALGLSDRGRFLEEHHSAIKELPGLLSRDDKLALMGLFYRMCQADGFVDETEIAVLRDVSVQLKLEWKEVETYLLNLW